MPAGDIRAYYQQAGGGDDWFGANAPPAAPADAGPAIQQWYRQYLGREASPGEVQGWLANPSQLGTVEQQIRESPEAKAHAPTAAPGAANGGRGDPEGFRAAWFASGGKTTADLAAFVAAHPEFGATITGSKGSKLTFPGGQAFQAVRSAGLGGGIGPAWDDISGGEGGGQGGAAGTQGFGGMIAPWTQNFTAPTAEQAMQSPGLQFAMDEAQQGLEKSAAARGTLLTGGTLKDLTKQRVGMALQGYGDAYNRASGEYLLGRENFYNNQDRPYAKLSDLTRIGAGAAAQTGGFGTSYGSGANEAQYGAGNAGAAGSIAQGNIWGNYFNNVGNQPLPSSRV